MTDDPEDKASDYHNHWSAEAGANRVSRPTCDCLEAQYGRTKWRELRIHTERQDTTCSGWRRLNELIEQAAHDGRERFSPATEMSPEEWAEITVLPPTIAKLTAVKHFVLYGSSLVRIPPEIGEMESLEEFSPYTSYRLHWLPYEILRCKKLRRSAISTRALYGNYKFRAPFPRLPQIDEAYLPSGCSICRAPLEIDKVRQVWISLPSGSDVVPLLLHACGGDCIAQLPAPPENYVQNPHRGGLGLQQPKKRY